MKKVRSVRITPTVPFHFDATFYKPDHFPSGDTHWQPGTRWQAFFWRDRPVGLKITNEGVAEKPEVRVDVFSSSSLDNRFLTSLVAEVRYRFNLDLDLSRFNEAFEGDSLLSPVIHRLLGMRPGHPSSLYEYLIVGTVLQNATVKRSIQMLEALGRRYGALVDFEGRQLWSFWVPGDLRASTEDDLRALKVGYRARTLKRIDDAFDTGLLDEFELRDQDVESQRRRLLELYGVGPATVGYLLFDVFHHWNHLDHISPWERKIYSRILFETDPDDPVSGEVLFDYLERFEPYRGLALHYLWEDLWWRREREQIPWLEKLIRA